MHAIRLEAQTHSPVALAQCAHVWNVRRGLRQYSARNLFCTCSHTSPFRICPGSQTGGNSAGDPSVDRGSAGGDSAGGDSAGDPSVDRGSAGDSAGGV